LSPKNKGFLHFRTWRRGSSGLEHGGDATSIAVCPTRAKARFGPRASTDSISRFDAIQSPGSGNLDTAVP
jgi:hypothetical protein